MGNAIVTDHASTFFEPEDKYTELLIGCGVDRRKNLTINARKEWENLTTLDMIESVNPDVMHDLNNLPYPFNADSFNEIHAYEVLEHCGSQGDWRFFFDQFAEFHRILKPNGLLYATVPSWDSVHAWGDPGHTRVINESTIVFLLQKSYGNGTTMTDYRERYKLDFEVMASEHQKERYLFCLRAIK